MGWMILLVSVVLAALWAVSLYNRLVRRKNLVAEAWAGIDAQLKRRTDLIPNLVETVKGYAAHERGVLDELVRLRSGGAGAGRGGKARANRKRDRRRPGARDCRGRSLPGPESQREFPVAADGTGRHRGPDPAGEALLQRDGARLQCDDRAVPVESRGEVRRLQTCRSE